MILRYLISITFLSVMIAIAPLSVQADTNESTSIELYEQGMQLFETGQYAEARKVLWDLKLVPADLSPEQRVAMWSTMQKIDQQMNASEDPQQLLAQAQEVQSAGQLVEAQKINRKVINSGKSTDKQKSLAQTRLADIKRQLEPQIVSLRHQIDAARADINANQLDEATAKLQAVKQSPVSLGWYDQQSISQLLAKIDERREQRLALANDSSKYDAVTQKGKAQKNTETTANKPRGKSLPGDRLRDYRKLLAQQQMVDGRKAEQRSEFHLAAKHYAEAVDLDPDNEQATTALEAAREKAQAKSTPTGPLQRQLEIRELQRQEAVSEYKQLMNRAGVLREQRRFKEALELVNQAKAMLDRNKNVIPSGQYNRLRHEAERLDADIDQERRIAEAEDKQQTEQQAKALAVEQRMAAEQEKYLVTQDLLKQAIDLLAEQKYEEALDKLDYAEFWDPGNPAVQALIHSAEITQAIAESKAIRKDRTQAVVEHSLGNLRATYPQPEILVYPPDWPEITRKRLFSTGRSSVEDKMNRAVKIKLQQSIQEIDFDTQALDYAIDFIRQITETNIYVNWNALRDAGIDEDTTINLKLNNVPADHALALLLRQVSTDLDPVTYSIRKGIVEISTRQDLTMTTVTMTYDIQDLMFLVPRFGNAPQFDLNQALSNTNSGGSGTGSSSTSGSGGGSGSSGGGNSGSGGSGNNQSGWDTDSDDDAEEQPTRLEVVENLADLIRNTVGRPDEWVELGGSVSSLRELNGTLIIRTTTDNHQEVTTLLNQLRDARAVQISVEARFLLVDQNFLEDIGADVDITISDVGGKWGDIVISQDSFGVTAAPSTGFPGGFLPSPGGAAGTPSGRSLDLSLSYLDDLQVSLLVRASQQHRRSITLTAPRLTLMNGQRAFLYVARQISFVSDVEPIADAIGFDPTLSVLNEGVVLDVEATVSADRRYVTMTAMPSLSTIVKPIRKETQTVLFTTEDDPDTPDVDESSESLISASIEVPEAEITEIQTTVSVPDRGTLLMGGQRLVGEVEVEAGVPVLSKIPFLNRIFTNRSTVKDERTLLILIKPTIIIQSEEEEQNFPNIPDMLNNPAEYDRSSRYAF